MFKKKNLKNWYTDNILIGIVIIYGAISIISGGKIGKKGDKGDKGNIGPRGYKGEFGGPKGDKGDKGTDGEGVFKGDYDSTNLKYETGDIVKFTDSQLYILVDETKRFGGPNSISGTGWNKITKHLEIGDLNIGVAGKDTNIKGDFVVDGKISGKGGIDTTDLTATGKITGGTLDVTGAAVFSNTVKSIGDFNVNIDKFTVDSGTGNTELAGTLRSIGNFDVNNKFTVASSSGNTVVLGTFKANGNSQIGGTLNVTGATVFSNTVKSTGDFNVNTDKFTVASGNGNTVVAGTFNANSNSQIGGTLDVTGAAVFSDTVKSIGDLTASGKITGNGGIDTTDLTASNKITGNGGIDTTDLTASNKITTKELSVSGNTTVKDINIDGNISFCNQSTVNQSFGSDTVNIDCLVGSIISVNNLNISGGGKLTLRITNNKFKASSLIFTSIKDFSGDGIPYIYIKDVHDGGFNIIINNLHPLTNKILNGPLIFNFQIY